MIPYETYYCECEGASDPSYPTLKLNSGATTFNFKPQDYLVYEKIESSLELLCMVSF